jgi:hypothetical protein
LSANQLPNSGVVNYEGTFSGSDFTAPISITVGGLCLCFR